MLVAHEGKKKEQGCGNCSKATFLFTVHDIGATVNNSTIIMMNVMGVYQSQTKW